MFTDRKPRELLKQYSRISIVDGTSLQANLKRQQSFKRNAPNPLQRGLSMKSLKSTVAINDNSDGQGMNKLDKEL
jgi:hypothetical protein